MSHKTKCMIRLDDITPDMNWEGFYRAKEIFDRYQICPLIGVVPDNNDETLHKEERKEELIAFMKTAGCQSWERMFEDIKQIKHNILYCVDDMYT